MFALYCNWRLAPEVVNQLLASSPRCSSHTAVREFRPVLLPRNSLQLPLGAPPESSQQKFLERSMPALVSFLIGFGNAISWEKYDGVDLDAFHLVLLPHSCSQVPLASSHWSSSLCSQRFQSRVTLLWYVLAWRRGRGDIEILQHLVH
ncbi:hypothetical protein KSP39_PZI014233 [Platanthera zijinensis]|uniref:Uncharacterized protein n=1 Tax=Platanthera zijinensis TaxID=2320716 RepID=A0AAP0BAV8_9ASPA